MIPVMVWTARLAAAKALVSPLVSAVKGLWRMIRPKRWPKPAGGPAAPETPRRRRTWGGGPPAAAALLLALVITGCKGPLAGLTKAEQLDYINAVAPCPDCPKCSDPTPAPVPGPPAPVTPPSPVNPAPAPDPGPAPGDEIDLSSVTWLHRSPAAFPVTAELRSWSTDGRNHSVSYQHPPDWKVSGGRVVGNVWIIGQAKHDGRWYGATFEHLLDQRLTDPPGQFSRKLEYRDPAVPFLQAEASPIDRWRPRPGEEVGILISTITRGQAPAGAPVGRSLVKKHRLP